jgi:hypothetical protein
MGGGFNREYWGGGRHMLRGGFAPPYERQGCDAWRSPSLGHGQHLDHGFGPTPGCGLHRLRTGISRGRSHCGRRAGLRRGHWELSLGRVASISSPATLIAWIGESVTAPKPPCRRRH